MQSQPSNMDWAGLSARMSGLSSRTGEYAGRLHSETIAVADTAMSKIDAAGRRCVPTLGNSALKVRDQTGQGLGRTRHNSVVRS